MSKLLVVFGATGQQGGSVIETVINDPELSAKFKLRGVTRDTSSPKSQILGKKGVEMVQGDASSASSLASIMQNAHTVFGVTSTVYDTEMHSRELAEGKAMADAAVAAGATYIIFSSLISIKDLSNGTITHGGQFDVKADIEAYIRTLPIQSAFFHPGSFMQNFHTIMSPQPSPTGDGTFMIANFMAPGAKTPLIDTVGDTGKYIGAILADPDKYAGKVFSASTSCYSWDQTAEIMSAKSGKTIKYAQLPKEVFKGFFPPHMADPMVDMFQFIEEFGYFGPGTEEKVKWTAEQARGKLATLEDYLDRNPLNV